MDSTKAKNLAKLLATVGIGLSLLGIWIVLMSPVFTAWFS